MLQLLSSHKLSLLLVQFADFLRIYIVNETPNKQKGDLKIQESVQVQVPVLERHHLISGRSTLPSAKGWCDLGSGCSLQLLRQCPHHVNHQNA